MKIANGITTLAKTIAQVKSTSQPKPTVGVKGNFDSFVIEKKPAVSEEEFVMNLKNKLSGEIKSAASLPKLTGIKQNLNQEEYMISADEIARKIAIGL